MDEKPIQTTLRFAPEFHERVRVAVAKRRLRSIQQAVDEALLLWLNEKEASVAHVVSHSAPAAAGETAEERAEVAKFLDFLRSGDPGAVRLVKLALESHAQDQRKQRKRSSA